MKDRKRETVWVEELCGYLRKLAESPTEEISNFGTCHQICVFGDGHGHHPHLDEEFYELGVMYSNFSGCKIYPVAGADEFEGRWMEERHAWDTELRREYALELADLIEEAWEAAA